MFALSLLVSKEMVDPAMKATFNNGAHGTEALCWYSALYLRLQKISCSPSQLKKQTREYACTSCAFFNCCFFFLDIIGQDLLDSFNASYDIGELSISQRRGAITLAPKEDSN